MFQSPFDQPNYGKKPKKRAKKKAKAKPPARKAKKKVVQEEAKKKRAKKLPVSRTKKAPPCGPMDMAAATVEFDGKNFKLPLKEKVRHSKSCKGRKAPKVGKKLSDWLYPKCNSKAATAAQRKQWQAGKIPTLYPEGGYEQGRAPKEMHDWQAAPLFKGKSGKMGIPPGYGEPDLAWFVDPAVAGTRAGKIIVFFSGGKDSLACLLYVIEVVLSLGLNPSETIECIHHCVDGRPWFYGGSGINEFDWPCTEDYCRVICACLGIPLLFNWREGGLMGEVLKGGEGDPLVGRWEKSMKVGPRPTARMFLEMPVGGRVELVEPGYAFVSGGVGEYHRRRSFPPQGPVNKAGRTYRWCSPVVKIDLGRSHVRNRQDLYGKRVLCVSGERAEESPARQGYFTREFEAGHGSRDRHVERWRPIHKWCEIDVWALIYRWKIRPHPAYRLGWGRLSCMTCIFGSKDMWASIAEIDRRRFDRFVEVEELLAEEKVGVIKQVESAYKSGRITRAQYDKDIKNARGRIVHIKAEGKPIATVAEKGEPYKTIFTRTGQRLVKIALSHRWTEDPIESPWRLPAGAFGEASGPI